METRDRQLFTYQDKSPMVFCLRPCSIKSEVKKLILNGGGMCFSTLLKVPESLRKDVIYLLPDGETSWDDNALSAKWIVDCAKDRQLIETENYLRKPTGQEVDREMRGVGRMPFSRKEDINILLYVRENAGIDSSKIGGNTFWKKLEKLNTFQLHGRSWQSLRDRYFKRLKGRESEYPLGGRVLGPLPMPPKQLKRAPVPRIDIPEKNSTIEVSNVPGLFLADVESRRNHMSPGLSHKEYEVLINDFVTRMQRVTKLDSKSIHKVLFKCDGDEAIAKHFLLNGVCPEGYYMFDDSEDEILLKCLLNPTTCDETPAKVLANEIGEDAVLRRAAALLGVSRDDFRYMKSIPLRSIETVSESSME